MSDIEQWVRLARLELSPKKAVSLVDYFGEPAEVFRAPIAEIKTAGALGDKTAERIREATSTSADEEMKALDKIGARAVTIRDGEYPANLRQIYDPPPVLFVKGELREEDRFAVAIVGTRRPSEYGRSMAMKVSRDLAARGLTVISGGARGIDTTVHTAAIAAGRTIAILGSGLDVPYPYENRGLFKRIAESGAVMSEYVPGTKPDGYRFPARNRLISGMSLGVLIVESLITGGAMITAGIAADQNRDVYAVPGATDNEFSEGPHRLIREGAKLVERAEDILEEIGVPVEHSDRRERPKVPDNITPEQKVVLEALNLHPKHVDDIIAECGLSASVANSTLTLLEMLGLVRRVPGNAYVRAV
ncbi:MAG: DNA-processing protein DprA [Armatimonadetes bacterium]|nr:DNA-processing protein DprA [Armatimonadota bacterium]